MKRHMKINIPQKLSKLHAWNKLMNHIRTFYISFIFNGHSYLISQIHLWKQFSVTIQRDVMASLPFIKWVEKKVAFEKILTTGCPNNDCFFSKAHCSFKNYPILKISSLLGRQWIDFYVGIIYDSISSFI